MAQKNYWVRLALATTAALGLAACHNHSTGSYRVASVGTTSADDGSGGGTAGGGDNGSGTGGGTAGGGSGGSGSGGGSGTQGGLGSNVLVTSGNAMIGAGGASANLLAGVPASGLVSAKVSGMLESTGQTLVQLGNGNTLILDGTGGTLGDVVSLDLGKGKVIGSSASGSPLIGLNVLAKNPTTGRLATVNAKSGGKLVGVTVPNGALGTLKNGVTGTNVGATVNGVVNTGAATVNSTTSGSASKNGVTVNGVTGAVTKPVQGVVGVGGTVTPPKPPK